MRGKKLWAWLALGCYALGGSTVAWAQPPSAGGGRAQPGEFTSAEAAPEDAIMNAAGWDQKMNAQVPLDLDFQDESGKTVKLRDYFGKKPVVLTLVFYNCTMLCTEILGGTARAADEMKFSPGEDYEIVTISINHRETPQLAREKKALYLKDLKKPGIEKGWHFLVGSEQNIKSVADAVGFHYEYDPRSEQYAHPNGITILTPSGHVSNYMTGIDYSARDMRFNLIKAAGNEIGTPIDQIFLTCFHFNPSNGKYSLSIMRVMRLAGLATVALLAMSIFGAVKMGKKKNGES